MGLRLLGAPRLELRQPGADLELGHQVAVGRDAAGVLEGGVEQRERAGGITAIERQLGKELARQHVLALGAAVGGDLQRATVVLFGALEAAAAAGQHPDREQRARLAGQVAGVARDLERLAEVLLGQVPLPEPVADQAEVLVMAAHARVEARALVELEGLLQQPRGLAPLAQVLIDEAEVVERDHEAVGVVDAPERGRRVLEPLDRFGVPPQSGAAHAAGHCGPRHRAMLVAVPQGAVGVERVAAAAAVLALVAQRRTHQRRRARGVAVVLERPGDGAGLEKDRESRIRLAAERFGGGLLEQQADPLGRSVGRSGS